MRAGERAALVTEQLALDQLAGNSGHVDGNERSRPAPPIVVQRACYQFLAGARLARDHHGEVGRGQPGDRAINLLHGDRAADQRQLLVLLDRFAGWRDRRRSRQGASDDGQKLLQVERLRQVFERPPLGCLHGGHQGGLRAHDHDLEIRPHPADAWNEIEPVLVRHHHVGDDQVALAILHPAPQRGCVRAGAHLITGPSERLGQHGADGPVVIGNQDGWNRHLTPQSSGTKRTAVRFQVRQALAQVAVSA